MYINDIIDENGRFLSLDDVKQKFDTNMCFMLYNSIKDAFPNTWKKRMKTSYPLNIVTITSLLVKTYERVKKLSDVTTKDVYWTFISKITQPPTSNAKWEEIYPNCNFDWKQIFITPYRLIRDTNIQSLQYRIIHRFFPCNYTLNKWYTEHSSKCSKCCKSDTLEHYFVDCEKLKYFWSSFVKWWLNISKINLKLSTLDIVFGIPNENSDVIIDLANYCILLAKSFIYNMKKNLQECNFCEFLIHLKTILEYEKFSYLECDKQHIFNASLAKIYNEL